MAGATFTIEIVAMSEPCPKRIAGWLRRMRLEVPEDGAGAYTK
jgi:hypothetical protein